MVFPRNGLRRASAALLTWAALVGPIHAAFTEYYSQSAWEAAVADVILENLDSLQNTLAADLGLTSVPYVVGTHSFTAVSGTPTLQRTGSFKDGSSFLSWSGSTGSIRYTKVTIPSAFGIAFDYYSSATSNDSDGRPHNSFYIQNLRGSSGTWKALVNDSDESRAASGFYGIVDDGGGINAYEIGTTWTNWQSFGADNFRYATALWSPSGQIWYGDGHYVGGSGTWSATGLTWGNGTLVGKLDTRNPAVFGSPDGTVTIASTGVASTAGMQFDVGTRYELTGGTLTLAGQSAAANTLFVNNWASATISAPLAGTSGFRKTGSGELIVSGAGTLSGTVTVAEGTLGIAHQTPLGNAGVAVSGGTLSITTSATLGDVTVNAGGKLVMDPAVSRTLSVGLLTMDTTGAGALVDVGAGRIEIAAGANATAIRSSLLAGLGANANWLGTVGITSSAAAATPGIRSVGYRVAEDGSGLLAFAAPGDANLDGVVNTLDLVAITAARKFGTDTPAVWAEGDFNYDGVVNSLDLVAIDGSGAWGIGNYLPLPSSSVAAIPEPATAYSLAVAFLMTTAAMLHRRRADAADRGTLVRAPRPTGRNWPGMAVPS